MRCASTARRRKNCVRNPRSCLAACYDCLLSYSNQLDAFFIDRREVLRPLLDLTGCRVLPRVAGRTYAEHLARLRSFTDARSELERRFL